MAIEPGTARRAEVEIVGFEGRGQRFDERPRNHHRHIALTNLGKLSAYCVRHRTFEIVDLGNGQKRAVDTQVYETYEIERIAEVAFDLARTRDNKVCSMEKRNVMKSGLFWNEVVTETHAKNYSDVELSHMLADAGGMQLVRWPKQFDVIVTDNLFGDMLSDVAAMLTGSLGMLPSASLGAPDEKTGKRKAMYEPVHGSAPDIAGQGEANPIAMIASFAMMLRYSFNKVDAASRVENAIASVLDQGLRTGDIMSEGMTKVGTNGMGAAILSEIQKDYGK